MTVHQPAKILPARFYRTKAGSEPVRDWLKTLNAEDRKIIGADVAEIEFDWPIGLPLCKSLKSGLWEVRSNISNGRTVRTIFTIVERQMVLLHVFIKRSQKTPKRDLDLAARRKKELEQ